VVGGDNVHTVGVLPVAPEVPLCPTLPADWGSRPVVSQSEKVHLLADPTASHERPIRWRESFFYWRCSFSRTWLTVLGRYDTD